MPALHGVHVCVDPRAGEVPEMLKDAAEALPAAQAPPQAMSA